jgi:hypothetical protein
MLQGTLNPFREKNFSAEAVEQTSAKELDHLKLIGLPDPRATKSLAATVYAGTPFNDEERVKIDNMVEGLRDSMDLPFDELYHKEKKMIQDVIDAEKDLEARLATLIDPVETMRLDASKLDPEQRREYQDILDQFESPYELS